MTKRKAAAKAHEPSEPKETRADFLRREQARAYDNGRRAASSNIPRDLAPAFMSEDEHDAWHLGHKSIVG